MRDAIAWSYDLLAADEQTCSGGWRSSSAASPWRPPRPWRGVDGWTSEISDSTVLEGIASLVDKSLLRLERRSAASRAT